MAIEREKKYLLQEVPAEVLAEVKPVIIRQGYLIIGYEAHLRVRIVDNDVAFLTYKKDVNRTDKEEYEYPIPLVDGLELFHKSPSKLVKKRYKTSFEGNDYDIDVYKDGLVIAEIEYEKLPIKLPSWFKGQEVTGQKQYSNIAIAVGGEPK